MGLYSSPQKSTLGLEFELIFPHKKKKKKRLAPQLNHSTCSRCGAFCQGHPEQPICGELQGRRAEADTAGAQDGVEPNNPPLVRTHRAIGHPKLEGDP